MQERISRLEGHYESLSSRMGGMEQKMDRVLNILSEQRAKQLPPLQTILTTAAVSMGIVSSAIAGFFWLVDARVGSAVANSNTLVQQLTDKGGIWVWKTTVEDRLTAIEKDVNGAIKWRPVFTSTSDLEKPKH
jgi:hypothetical protein